MIDNISFLRLLAPVAGLLLVGRALAGKPIEVYGDGQQVRCFCDVRDVAAHEVVPLGEPLVDVGPGE